MQTKKLIYLTAAAAWLLNASVPWQTSLALTRQRNLRGPSLRIPAQLVTVPTGIPPIRLSRDSPEWTAKSSCGK